MWQRRWAGFALSKEDRSPGQFGTGEHQGLRFGSSSTQGLIYRNSETNWGIFLLHKSPFSDFVTHSCSPPGFSKPFEDFFPAPYESFQSFLNPDPRPLFVKRFLFLPHYCCYLFFTIALQAVPSFPPVFLVYLLSPACFCCWKGEMQRLM